MFVKLPVHCNVQRTDEEGKDVVYLKTPGNTSPTIPKTWQHPKHTTDPRRVIAAVARSRSLINRSTTSAVTREPLVEKLSLLAHLSGLACKWDLIGYTLNSDQIQGELCERGPVLASIPVCASLLEHVSTLLDGADPATHYAPITGETELGMVSCAILGWKGDSWLVALPWGDFSKSVGDWNGCVYIPRGKEEQVCALVRKGDISTKSKSHGFRVTIVPTEYPSIPRPPVQSTVKPKHKHTDAFRAWFNDEHMSIVVKCAVTTTIIVLAVFTILVLRRRK